MVVSGGAGARFIPARAGNRKSVRAGLFGAAVHPRTSGEQADAGGHVPPLSGSSPHERGTGDHLPCPFPTTRFIPARAGNRYLLQKWGRECAVHPRTSGEQVLGASVIHRSEGSSPHERGTEPRAPGRLERGRFIPARAGNSRLACPSAARMPVHPRTSGEQSSSISMKQNGKMASCNSTGDF